MKASHRVLLHLFLILGVFLTPGCFSTDPEFGGGASIFNEDGPSALGEVLESEPPPVRPDNHMDPHEKSHGAVSLQFGEDLQKTAKGPDKEPWDD